MEAGSAAIGTPPPPDREGPLRRAISRRMLLFFIIGDVIGAGIYVLVGEVGGEIGGAIWVAFTVALVLALCTAFAYAELVTKYPHAGGAALFVHRAYRIPFVTFIVAFAVMASGITSASTLSRSFGGDYFEGALHIDAPTTLVAIAFIVLVALINFRGISESVKTNMALTAVELTGLIILAGTALATRSRRRTRTAMFTTAKTASRNDRAHFTAPAIFPILGLVISVILLIKRFADVNQTQVYILLLLLGIGIVLWLMNRYIYGRRTGFDPARLET